MVQFCVLLYPVYIYVYTVFTNSIVFLIEKLPCHGYLYENVPELYEKDSIFDCHLFHLPRGFVLNPRDIPTKKVKNTLVRLIALISDQVMRDLFIYEFSKEITFILRCNYPAASRLAKVSLLALWF